MKNLLFFLLLFTSTFSLNAQQPYYSDVNLTLTGQDLYFALQSKIDQASSIFNYGDVRFSIEVMDRDPNNSGNVLLVYGYNDTDSNCTTDRTRDKDDFGGLNCEWNREHVFARSNTNPAMGDVNNETTGIGADPHNLRSSDQQMNNNKGNRKFASGSGNAGVVEGGDWYPGEEWKGDVARMIMYMYTRYGNRCLPSLTTTGVNQGSTDMLQVLLQWNVEDPVSAFEDQRNPHLENVYGNRNPFIDNPYLATIIWGGTAAEDRWNIFSVTDNNNKEIIIYPNPTTESIFFKTSTAIEGYTMYNLLGKKVLQGTNADNSNTINVASLPSGIYLLEFFSDKQKHFKKIVVN